MTLYDNEFTIFPKITYNQIIMKVKIWLGKDTNYNYPYYKVIGEMEDIPKYAKYFVMKWKRWTPHQKQKFSLFGGKMHLYTVFKPEEQESLFKIINRDNLGIMIVELVENEM